MAQAHYTNGRLVELARDPCYVPNAVAPDLDTNDAVAVHGRRVPWEVRVIQQLHELLGGDIPEYVGHDVPPRCDNGFGVVGQEVCAPMDGQAVVLVHKDGLRRSGGIKALEVTVLGEFGGGNHRPARMAAIF